MTVGNTEHLQACQHPGLLALFYLITPNAQTQDENRKACHASRKKLNPRSSVEDIDVTTMWGCWSGCCWAMVTHELNNTHIDSEVTDRKWLFNIYTSLYPLSTNSVRFKLCVYEKRHYLVDCSGLQECALQASQGLSWLIKSPVICTEEHRQILCDVLFHLCGRDGVGAQGVSGHCIECMYSTGSSLSKHLKLHWVWGLLYDKYVYSILRYWSSYQYQSTIKEHLQSLTATLFPAPSKCPLNCEQDRVNTSSSSRGLLGDTQRNGWHD